jgi:hypothetical protein
MRKPGILKNYKSLIILLNSLYKKLISNEGVLLDDDLYRDRNETTLKKVQKILQESPDVQNALNVLKDNRHRLDNNKLVGYLTFL